MLCVPLATPISRREGTLWRRHPARCCALQPSAPRLGGSVAGGPHMCLIMSISTMSYPGGSTELNRAKAFSPSTCKSTCAARAGRTSNNIIHHDILWRDRVSRPGCPDSSSGTRLAEAQLAQDPRDEQAARALVRSSSATRTPAFPAHVAAPPARRLGGSGAGAAGRARRERAQLGLGAGQQWRRAPPAQSPAGGGEAALLNCGRGRRGMMGGEREASMTAPTVLVPAAVAEADG